MLVEPFIHTIEPFIHTVEPLVHTVEPLVYELEVPVSSLNKRGELLRQKEHLIPKHEAPDSVSPLRVLSQDSSEVIYVGYCRHR